MTLLPVGTETRLDGNMLFQVANGVSHSVECVEGVIWITQARMPCDIVLTAGERVLLTAPARALVGALNGRAVVRAMDALCAGSAA